jgi:hypothetical protein
MIFSFHDGFQGVSGSGELGADGAFLSAQQL